MNDILSGTYKGNTYRIKVECYPNTPDVYKRQIIGVEKRQLAELEVVLHADKPDLRNLAAVCMAPIWPAAVMLSLIHICTSP